MYEKKFPLGHVSVTNGALHASNEANESLAKFLYRHQSGDWGDIDQEDKAENDFSLTNGFRILSAYHFTNGTELWIVTEADRSATILLLPHEY